MGLSLADASFQLDILAQILEYPVAHFSVAYRTIDMQRVSKGNAMVRITY
jgi:hypothetical protein